MLDPGHLKLHVVRPALQRIGMWSSAAENLVMGTAMQESALRYLAQLSGPALGLWQIEPATHRDVWENYLRHRPGVARSVLEAGCVRAADASPWAVDDDVLTYNLRYAAAICRVIYRRVPTPLPKANDWPGLAQYWKQHYNTYLGAGQQAEFIAGLSRLSPYLES